ncbi:hypothetical protein NXY25_27290 [Bacteroides thetaiotaomicron]|nr:hypothetical protein [Bacteroides thetaiotaomicron]
MLNTGRFDKVDSKVVANYKKQKRLIAEAEKELKVYESSSKQESAADKLRKEQEKYNLLINKQALEKKRQIEDLENQLTQTKINKETDGFKRVQLQRELDNKKRFKT